MAASPQYIDFISEFLHRYAKATQTCKVRLIEAIGAETLTASSAARFTWVKICFVPFGPTILALRTFR